MGEDEQLRSIINLRTKPKPDRTVKLGEVIRELMERRISPQHTMFGLIDELWNQLLPAELSQHCEIIDISGGCLKVLVDSSSYMYELRLCSSQILEQLQSECPRAQIKKIKFVIGR